MLRTCEQENFLQNSHSKLHRAPYAQSSSPYHHILESTSSMGLCASMLLRKAKKGQPEPRRSTPKVLFVVRNGGQQSKPEALVLHPHSNCRSGLQKPSRTNSREEHDKQRYDCMDVLSKRLRVPKPPRLLQCGSTRSIAVEPMAADEVRVRPPVFRGATAGGRPPPPAAAATEVCRTPMTPRRTPVWQRRILMGTRCELPRFSGLILYDEHGRPLQTSSRNRADHLISRSSKYEFKGKKKTARASTTLRDLL